MALVLTQEGAIELWQWMLGIAVPTIPKVHLLGNGFTPLHSSIQADFAEFELIAGGYAPFDLSDPAANWEIGPNGQGANAANLQPNWILTSAASICGYWLSDATSTKSLWGGLFPEPFTYNSGGGLFFLELFPSLISVP